MMEISLFKTERSTDLQAALAQHQESSRQLIESFARVMRQAIDAGERNPTKNIQLPDQ